MSKSFRDRLPHALASLNSDMACPHCGCNVCRCGVREDAHDAASTSQIPIRSADTMLVDPEAWDASEEQFEDSLIKSPEPEYRSIILGHEQNAAEYQNDFVEPPQPPPAVLNGESAPIQDDWRHSVASKLDSYRNKRGKSRLAGAYTMHLDFERSASRAVLTSAVAATAPVLEQECELDAQSSISQPDWEPEPADNPEPPSRDMDLFFAGVAEEVAGEAEYDGISAAAPVFQVPGEAPAPVRPAKAKRKVIEFPRLFQIEQPVTQADELAESLDRPRILDVPEETEQIELPLADINLEFEAETELVQESGRALELPLQVAPMSQRAFASLADWVVVLAATGLFAGIVLQMAQSVPTGKLVIGMALLVPCFFWALYHYLFLVYAAKTPGMLLAQLRLATFTAAPTGRQIRRARALAMIVSCASAGLGFGWAFVDEDTLCWHDKISHTYLTHRDN